MAENEADVMEFRKARQQLAVIERQKGQLEGQGKALEIAIKDIKESGQKKVWKGIGNILVEKDTSSVLKELENQKEEFSLKIATTKKQEESLVNRLNKLKMKMEGKTEEKTETPKKARK